MSCNLTLYYLILFCSYSPFWLFLPYLNPLFSLPLRPWRGTLLEGEQEFLRGRTAFLGKSWPFPRARDAVPGLPKPLGFRSKSSLDRRILEVYDMACAAEAEKIYKRVHGHNCLC